jgi:hypothetical protein
VSTRVIDVRGLPETKKLLDSFTGNELQNRVRRGTRAGAKIMRTELRKQATGSQFPKSFRKTATRGHRTPVGTSTGPKSPLINIFEGGADQHRIGKQGQALFNAGEGFFARGPVLHPGMAPRPLIGPVFDATKDRAAEAAMDVIFDERAPSFALSD